MKQITKIKNRLSGLISMEIKRATSNHISEVARLFDLYRQFYQCDADLELAESFIADRINNNESIIFIAVENGSIHGFVQLYPSFCSVDAIKIFILYDLYVDPTSRKSGIGEKLMKKASEYAKYSGAKRMDLLTAFGNHAGKNLYKKLGYKRESEDFHAYSLPL